MKTKIFLLAKTTLRFCILLFLIFCSGIGHAQFFNSPMGNAHSLKKGQKDVAFGYQYYRFDGDGFSGKLSDNLAVRLGVGVSDNFDVQIRYERIQPSDGLNYFSIAPKHSFSSNQWAVIFPVAIVFGEGDEIGIFSPTLMHTKRTSQKFEASFSLSSHIYTEDTDFLLDLNVGLGFSKNLERYAIRPELGIHFNPGESGYIWFVGIGVSAQLAGGGSASS